MPELTDQEIERMLIEYKTATYADDHRMYERDMARCGSHVPVLISALLAARKALALRGAVVEAAEDIFKDRTGQVEIAAAGMNRMQRLRAAVAELQAGEEE